MQITIAAVSILLLCFIIQLTKISQSKKLILIDTFLVIIAALTVYSEQMVRFTNIDIMKIKELFSQTYELGQLQMDETLKKNKLNDHAFILFYGVPKDGLSTFLKYKVTQTIKEGNHAIYIDPRSEIQSYDEALQLFGTKTLHELVFFIQSKPTFIAVNNIHLTISKKQCHICQVLSQLHKSNSTTIALGTKDMAIQQFLIDEYSVNIMEAQEFKNSKYRFDWSQEEYRQKQKEVFKNLNEKEQNLMKLIKEEMLKSSAENKNIKLNQIKYEYTTLKQLVDRNYIIMQLGMLRFYNEFIYDSVQI